MVTIAITATVLVLLGVAVDYSTQISRATQRSRRTARAMEIADGHLETLFTQWRNTYRTTWSTQYGSYTGAADVSLCGTNFFYTAMSTPAPAPTPIQYMSPAATPPIIPLPNPSNFPTSNYTVGQYRIQAVDPMITLDANGNAQVESNLNSKGSGNYVSMSAAAIPPAAYGPNTYQYSFFYLASVDVTVPALSGNVTAKVRRVFEKKFDQPWTYAMFYIDDLELQPSSAFTVTGPVHTNANLYIGNNNFTAGGVVEYGTDYVNGYSPKDPRYPGSGFTAPNFAKSVSSLSLSDCPPAQVSPYLPFGWNLTLNSSGGGTGTTNDDSYHEIIERPVAGADPLKNVRYYNQAGYRIIIHPDVYNADGTTNTVGAIDVYSVDSNNVATTLGGSARNKFIGNNGSGNSSTVLNRSNALYDAREGGAVKITNLDISQLISNLSSFTGWTGLVYIADMGATTYNTDGTVKSAGTSAPVTVNGVSTWTTKRAIRILNGYALPSPGLTIVSETPIYVQGNYNTSSTNNSSSIPSNTGTYTSPTAPDYTRLPSAIIGDAVTILSNAWQDSKSSLALTTRVASNTTVNAAIVGGIIPSSSAAYSGGGENFVRLLEDWHSNTLCYYGSLVELFRSNQGIGTWNGDGLTVYAAPSTAKFYYDDKTFSAYTPPGNLTVAAYLQQQRWYQVY
ncbi:MAG: hypothetical protein M3Z64_09375 [Verrucomicrobiota bacterium]|nr:hypothetical protein [Verrucomicrobiota bacterium]